MESAGLDYIIYFYSRVDVFLLILVRIIGFVVVLPIFSSASIPTLVKVLFSVAVAYLIFVTDKIGEVYYYNSVPGYVTLIAQEFITGMIMAFVAYVVFTSLYFAGQMIDYQIGFSMVNIFDPISQIQVPIVGNLLYFVLAVIMVQSGGFNALLSAVFYSYDVLPVGAAALLGNRNIISVLLGLLGNFFNISVRFAMPVVGSILVIDAALGLMVKAVPQMNVFVVGMPIKLLIGLILLYVITPNFIIMYDVMFNEVYRAVSNIVRSLVPG
ncbi:MAG: flagellar biosynthetic protein FliR [Clostridiales bacterium]|jgi:flagellar biosynthetic protein FliR|nr:flagellar biosynthetic protein FliR [Clostridiales bacterium]